MQFCRCQKQVRCHYVFVSLYLGEAQAYDTPQFSKIIIPAVSLQGSTLTFSAEPGVTRAVVLHELRIKSGVELAPNPCLKGYQ